MFCAKRQRLLRYANETFLFGPRARLGWTTLFRAFLEGRASVIRRCSSSCSRQTLDECTGRSAFPLVDVPVSLILTVTQR
jgi:hypothetical protein